MLRRIAWGLVTFLYVIGFNAIGMIVVIWTEPSFAHHDNKILSAILLVGGTLMLCAGYAWDRWLRRTQIPD